MVGEKFCNNCEQKSDCQEVYRQLGQSKGPSVVVKVLFAFLLPLLVFITCLVVFERIFSKIIAIKELQTPLSLISAISVTLALILIIKVINNRLCKNK